MLFIHRHEGPKPCPRSRVHQGRGLGDTESRSRTSSPAGRRPGHPDRRCDPEVPQPRAPGGRGPRSPAMSPARGPPGGGSSQKPCASRVHPLRRHRRCWAHRPERERPVPSGGALSTDVHAACRPARWARGVLSSPPGLATPSGAKMPTCKAEKGLSVKGGCSWGWHHGAPGASAG